MRGRIDLTPRWLGLSSFVSFREHALGQYQTAIPSDADHLRFLDIGDLANATVLHSVHRRGRTSL